MVADPQADDALRDRTDMVIRAVYAGASLPEPQIEHRWLSPKRGDARRAGAGGRGPEAAPAPRADAGRVARRRATRPGMPRTSRRDRTGRRRSATVADAEELRPVLPEGRVTAELHGRAWPASRRRAAPT